MPLRPPGTEIVQMYGKVSNEPCDEQKEPIVP
jgi:hypothetical protein